MLVVIYEWSLLAVASASSLFFEACDFYQFLKLCALYYNLSLIYEKIRYLILILFLPMQPCMHILLMNKQEACCCRALRCSLSQARSLVLFTTGSLIYLALIGIGTTKKKTPFRICGLSPTAIITGDARSQRQKGDLAALRLKS